MPYRLRLKRWFLSSGTGGYRRNLVTVSLLGGLFGVLGFVAVALFYHCSHKISGWYLLFVLIALYCCDLFNYLYSICQKEKKTF